MMIATFLINPFVIQSEEIVMSVYRFIRPSFNLCDVKRSALWPNLMIALALALSLSLSPAQATPPNTTASSSVPYEVGQGWTTHAAIDEP